MNHISLKCSALLALTLGLVACSDGGDDPAPAPAPTPVSVGDTVVLTASGKLASFNRATPGTAVGSIAVTGLTSGETLVGIDYRPANSVLYALGSAGSIYRVDPSTGVATLSSTIKAAAGDDNPFTTLSGTSFGVDFNPVPDRLRVVSNTGQNLRINVETGDAITDTAVSPAAAVSGVAYTNSFAGTVSTRLFDINLATSTLDLQNPPNDGTLVTGAPLGVTPTAVNGFDVDARSNTGYAALTVGGATSLYRVNLAAAAPTAAATLVGAIAGGEVISGLALAPATVPTVTGLTTDNRLVSFNPRSPNTLTSNVAITGLNAGESILGMDVRPADGLLWALSSAGRIFTLDATTGAATFRIALTADATDTTAPFTALDGSATLSVDFNPVPDRMRVVSPLGQNLRINVATGATITDTPISRTSAPASVLAAAYTNSFAGTTATSLFDLDGNVDVLSFQNPPNDGILTDVGPLGLDTTGFAAIDIAGGDNGLILAALRAGATGPFVLNTISLTTGAATLYANTSGNAALSQIGGTSGPALRDIAISRL
jgi:Domain of unknown function (DUF4394)